MASDPRLKTVISTFNSLEKKHSDELVALVTALQASILSDPRRSRSEQNKRFDRYQVRKEKKLISQASESVMFGSTSTMAIINQARKDKGLPRISISKVPGPNKVLESTINRETDVILKRYKTMINGGYTVIDGKKIYWLKDSDKNTRKAVYDAVKAGIKEGKSVAELTEDLKPIFETLKTNAKITAHHELTYINDLSSDLRKRNQGIKTDTWFSVGDNRVRPLHQQFDGEIFKVGVGPWPSSYLNCRCVRYPNID
ncbi:MAG: minor capsid protein [Fermentimonas sp.]|jgi:SPP1 gp7 family putative phage head morphogenesis protein